MQDGFPACVYVAAGPAAESESTRICLALIRQAFQCFTEAIGNFGSLNDSPLAGVVSNSLKGGELTRDPRPGLEMDPVSWVQ
jgi:hypothetical protein